MMRFVPEEGPFTPQQHHDWCTKMWRRMDRNGSGTITRSELDCEEFRSVLRAAIAPGTGGSMGGVLYARSEMNMNLAVQYCLRKADLNQDNSLSFEEFKSFLATLRQEGGAERTADLVFALFDVDQDGMIDEAEFREIYRFYLGHNPTELEFMEEWGRLDATAKFKVTREEYTQWLQTSSNPIFRRHGPPLAEVDPKAAESGTSFYSAAPASSPWRPWTHNTRQCWARVHGGRDPPASVLSATVSSGFGRPGSGPGASSRSGSSLQKSASSSSILMRPKWNQRLAVANANWEDKFGRPQRPKHCREYFSRPQSVSELERYYSTHRGFNDHLVSLLEPPKPRKKSPLTADVFYPSPKELREGCAKPAGYMRHPETKLRTKWEQHYHKVEGPTYVSGTIDLRSPGSPPKHLYMDLYDEEF